MKKSFLKIHHRIISSVIVLAMMIVSYASAPNDMLTRANSFTDGTIFEPNFSITKLPGYKEYTDSGYDESVKNIGISEYYSKYGTPEQYGPDYKIRIDTAEQLFLFSKLTNDLTTRIHFLSLDYILGNNIDYESYAQGSSNYFQPIGVSNVDDAGDIPFTGTFDGQGFEILNLQFAGDVDSVKGNPYFAFFASNKGVISNFGLVNPIINTTSVVGNMYVSGIAGKNLTGGRIEFVYVDDNRLTNGGYKGESSFFSGLVSLNQEGAVISNAYYSGIVAPSGCYAGDNIRPAVFINNGILEEVYFNRSRYLMPETPQHKITVAASKPTVTISAGDAAGYVVGQSINIGRSPFSDDISSARVITAITTNANGIDKDITVSGANITTVIGYYVWLNTAEPSYSANPMFGPGTVTGVKTGDLEGRKGCLTNARWKTHAYESVAAALFGYMRKTPRLYGFSGYTTSSWGAAASPFKILTSADLVYFSKFLSTKDSNVITKSFHVAACIDMSAVADDAYAFTQFSDTGRLFAIYGTSDGSEACAHHHFESVEGTKSHGIINLSMTQTVNGTVQISTTNVFTNADVIGFIPTSSSSLTSGFPAVKDLNFIGGTVKPTVNPASNILIAGSVLGSGLTCMDNVHSSMDVIISDGLSSPIYAGGIIGYSAMNYVNNTSFSGKVSGGVHPYNTAAAAIPDKNYSVGGICGVLYSSATTYTNVLSAGTVEAPGFYNIPTTNGKYASSDAGVLAGGMFGGTITIGGDRTGKEVTPFPLVNQSDIYTVPMTSSGSELVPRTGPSGEKVYSISPSVGGVFAYGVNLWHSEPYIVNQGNIYGYNMIGISSLAGILGTYYRSSHGWRTNYAVNFGNISAFESSGKLFLSGIQNRLLNGANNSFESVYNFGALEVDSSNQFELCAVAGISAASGTSAADTVPTSASTNLFNYGPISVNIKSDTCNLYVGGITAVTSAISGSPVYSNNQNLANIFVETEQASGDIKVCGLGQSSFENSVNRGNIYVNAAGASSSAISVGGITYYTTNAKYIVNTINAGNVKVVANTSGLASVGGIFASSTTVTSVNRCMNIGDITVENTGGIMAGGIIGSFTGSNNTYEIIDTVNSGAVTIKAGSSALTNCAGGIAGYAYNRFKIRNVINYGAISSETTGTGTVLQYTGGIVGYLVPVPIAADITITALNGYINFGPVSAKMASNDNSEVCTGGIVGLYSTNTVMTFTNLINNGSVTQTKDEQSVGNNIGSICGKVLFYSKDMIAGITFANHLNTVPGLNMYGTNTALTANSFARLAVSNLVTVNSTDPDLTGTASAAVPYKGRVTYKTNDSDGIYSPDLPFYTDTLNDCFIYNDNVSLVDARKNDFPDGMYALTISSGFSSKIYLPETLLIENIDVLSTDAAENAAGVKDKSWRTKDRTDFDGEIIAGSDIDTAYKFIMQVDNHPVIMTMTLQSDAVGKELVNTINYIQRRDSINNIFYFYFTENQLGREFYIKSWTTNDGAVYSTPEGGALNSIRFKIPSSYNPENDDPRNLDLEEKIYLAKPGNSEFVPVEYTVRLIFVPNPKMSLVSVTQSTQAGVTSDKKITVPAADITVAEDGAYVLPQPIYYSGTNSVPLLSFRMTTENLSSGFCQQNYATFTRDETGEDYTGKFIFSTSELSLNSTFIEKSDPPQYLSGTSKTGPASDNPGNTNVYTSSSTIALPEGYYTLRITVNNRVLMAVRFYRNVNRVGFPDAGSSSQYTIDMDKRTAVRNGSPFGLSAESRYFYPFGSTQRAYDSMLFPVVGEVQGAICTEGDRLLTDIKENPDGTHTYTNKVSYIPESGVSDKTWWTVTTNEALTGKMEIGGLRLNGTAQGDGTGFSVTTSNETIDNVINFDAFYSVIDFSSANSIKFVVKYTSGANVTELTQVPLTNNYAPRFSLNGQELVSITQTKVSSSNSVHNSSNITSPNGKYEYSIILSQDAPSGTYDVYFVYDREQTVALSTFDEETKEFTKNAFTKNIRWNYTFAQPLTITKVLNSDSYLKAGNIQGAMMEELLCVTSGHKHSSNPIIVSSGVINYSSTVLTGSNRDTDFNFIIYFNNGTSLTGKTFKMKTAPGASVYRKNGSNWTHISAEHAVDFVIGNEYEYKIVSEDGKNTTHYTVLPKELPKNKLINLDSGEGLGVANLQSLYEQTNDDLFITLRQLGTDEQGNIQVNETISADFSENNGMHLAYNFPLISAGAYVLDVTVPAGYSYELYKGDVKQTTVIPNIKGIQFTIDNIELEQLVNLTIVVSQKQLLFRSSSVGLYTEWKGTDYLQRPAIDYNITFRDSGALFTQITPSGYPNAIITPRQIRSSEAAGSCFSKGDVIVPSGIVITGDIFAKGNVYIHGKVIGDVHSEKSVILTGTVTGSVFQSSQ